MELKHFLLGVGFAFIWASAFPSAKMAVQFCPPFFFLFFRFSIAGLFSIILGAYLGQSFQFDRRSLMLIVVFGLIQNGVYLGLIFLALTKIDSNISVIIASILPLTVAFFSWMLFKTKMSLLGFCGLVVGLSGVLLIMLQRVEREYEVLGISLCLLGLLATTFSTLIITKININKNNILIVVGLQMLAGSLFLLPLSYFFEVWSVSFSMTFLFTFLYIAAFPGIIGPIIWFYLQKEIGAVKYSSFHFLVPFFGIGIAYFLLGETLTLSDMVGVFIIIIGLYLVNREKERV
ncbi:DMT family transporter [Paracoccaceae bacterium]|nr:DMT family transporter [Paracoccaceae bacterium]